MHRERTVDGRPITAVIPAAGRATRLGSTIAGSKEVVALAGRPVIAHLLHRLTAAHIERAVIALRTGKWDIPATLVGETSDGPATAYVVLDASPSPAHSIAAALRFLPEDVVALAFPDVVFEPVGAFTPMLDRLAETGADVVLGVFPSVAPERVDMVRLDETQRVVEIVIKQPDRGLRYCWAVAVWRPRFSSYLLRRLETDVDSSWSSGGSETDEFQIGQVIQAAIDDGIHTESIVFEDGSYIDVGTPEDLEAARSAMDAWRAADRGP